MRIMRHVFGLSLVLAIMSLAAASPRPAAADDYVVNGGFESGTNGWSASDSVKFEVDANVVSPKEGSGRARIELLSGSAAVAIRQTSWYGTPAGPYHLSAWVWTVSSGTQVDVQVSASPSSNTLRRSKDGSPDQWVLLEGDIYLTGVSNIAITIGGQGAPGDVIYVDDVRFEGAAPATMTPTATASPPPSATPPPDATATRTTTSTRTASPTKTVAATHTPGPLAAVADTIGPQLRNAGFEDVDDDGSPIGWRAYGGSLATTDVTARGGSHAARFESSTDATKWLYQAVSVSGGAGYAFGAWVGDDDENVAAAFLRVSWYASEDASGAALATDDSNSRLTSPAREYRYLTTDGIVAPAEAHSARLRIMLAPKSAGHAVIFADDASFGPADPGHTGAPAPMLATSDPGTEHSTPPVAIGAASHAARQGESGATHPATDTHALPPTSRVVINEVMYDPAGIGRDAEGEWVELYNGGEQPISLGGWSLADAMGADALPAVSVGPHEFVTIAPSDSIRQRHPDFAGALVLLGGRIGNSLGNDGDQLVLRDPSGAIADAISWGQDTTVLAPAIADVPSGHSIERRVAGADSDSASDFVDNERPTPGRAFEPPLAGARQASAREPGLATGTLAAGRNASFAWMPWAFAGAAGGALIVALSWRTIPVVAQRLRHHG
jgi:hypothetical protein